MPETTSDAAVAISASAFAEGSDGDDDAKADEF